MNLIGRYFLLLAFAVSFSACLRRNEKNVNAPCSGTCMIFNVKVTTGLNSLVPVGNATVELGWSKPATPLGDPGRLIAKGTTAANGTIQFTFTAQPKELTGGKFYLNITAGEGYFKQHDGYYGIVKADSIVAANVHLPSKGYVNVIYKNFTPTISTDFFQASPTFLSYGSSPLPVETKNANGAFANSFFFSNHPAFTRMELTATTAGDQFTYFSIIRNKMGVRIDKTDSIFVPKGQTFIYEVAY